MWNQSTVSDQLLCLTCDILVFHFWHQSCSAIRPVSDIDVPVAVVAAVPVINWWCVVLQIKCAQYWPSPDRETEIYNEFIVKLSSEDEYPDYTIRHLSLTNVSQILSDACSGTSRSGHLISMFFCGRASAEEGEELREGGDPHPVHELAWPRRSRGCAAPPETEAARQCF